MATKIEWADESWNPITGCTPISEGCRNCYAKKMAYRLAGRFGYDKDNPFKNTHHEYRLDEPKHWRKNKRIFVCSMGDLFHEDNDLNWIYNVITTMAHNPHLIYLLLTKRPKLMMDFIFRYMGGKCYSDNIPKFYPNWWFGVTVENQRCADERIPILLQIPAAVRFISAEPMLENIDLTKIKGCANSYYQVLKPIKDSKDANRNAIHWVVCGAETGPGKRIMKTEWALSLRDQCMYAGVPFFFKKGSNGSHELDGKTYEEYPKGAKE